MQEDCTTIHRGIRNPQNLFTGLGTPLGGGSCDLRIAESTCLNAPPSPLPMPSRRQKKDKQSTYWAKLQLIPLEVALNGLTIACILAFGGLSNAKDSPHIDRCCFYDVFGLMKGCTRWVVCSIECYHEVKYPLYYCNSKCHLCRQNPCSWMEIQIVTTEVYWKVHIILLGQGPLHPQKSWEGAPYTTQTCRCESKCGFGSEQ